MNIYLQTLKKYYFYLLIIFFSWLIPKKKGNYLIDYGVLRGNIECFNEISFKNDSIDRRIGTYKPWLKNLHLNSFKLLRSEYLIIDGDPTFLGVPFMRLFMNIFLIDLWHATGFKKIKLQSGRMKKGIIQEFSLGLKRYVCASSPNDALKKLQGYGKYSKILLIGSVQVDDLFKRENQNLNRRNTILYAPTFNEISKEYADKRMIDSLIFINKILKEKNWKMVIKPHPFSKYKFDLREYEKIQIFEEKGKRTNEILWDYDLLISDSSGIMTDYMLTGKPIIQLSTTNDDREMFY